MKRLVVLLVVLGVGVVLGMFNGVGSTAEAGGGQGGGQEECAAQNGDVNADGTVDISDGITVLGNLFLGNPPHELGLKSWVGGTSGGET